MDNDEKITLNTEFLNESLDQLVKCFKQNPTYAEFYKIIIKKLYDIDINLNFLNKKVKTIWKMIIAILIFLGFSFGADGSELLVKLIKSLL